jgi:hypothetical protein
MIEEDTMNAMFNQAIVAERVQSLQAEAGVAARHAAARARRPHRSLRGLAFAAALSRGRPGSTARAVTVKAGTLKAGQAL